MIAEFVTDISGAVATADKGRFQEELVTVVRMNHSNLGFCMSKYTHTPGESVV